MKRVLMILPSNHSVPPTENCSGISWLIHGLSNHFDSTNYQLTLLSIQKGAPAVNDTDVLYHYRNVALGKTFTALVWLLWWLPSRIKKKLFFSSNDNKIARCLLLAWYARSTNKSDLIIAHVYPTLVKVMSLVGIPKNKVIFYFHTNNYAALPPYILQFLNRFCKGLIMITKESIEPEVFNKPIQYILNAVDVRRDSSLNIARLNIAPDDFAIIYAGQIVKNKGIKSLILAIRPLIDDDDKIKLFIVGRIPNNTPHSIRYLEELEKLARDYTENIIFTGYIPHNELGELYPRFKLGVLLSQEREGNSLFLMECIASGIPVIASNIGGIPLVVDNGVTGLLVDDPKDTETVQNKLRQLIYNHEFYRKLQVNCLEASRGKFSFSRAARQLETFLSELD